MEDTTNTGFLKVPGGWIPKITSRIIPPPMAVVIPSTLTPKISIFLLIPMSAPDEAKSDCSDNFYNILNPRRHWFMPPKYLLADFGTGRHCLFRHHQ